ncbi:MAG: acetyl-CoA acetyltransferase [bacterium]|nr:acetyl-CoA acetyltransferase [bacterium]
MALPLPVLVGAGQVTDRPADPRAGLEPLALMEAAARAALADAGPAAALRDAVDTVAVVTNVFHDYLDTASMLAARLGCRPGRRLLSTWGGNTPISLLAHCCDEIAAGRSAIALIAGGEAFHTMRALGKAGIPSPWTPPADTPAPRWGDTRQGTSDLEARHGAREATVTYALVENAYRAARGLSLDAHRAELGAYAARCTRVAAENPHAWFPVARDAAALTAVTPVNRMVAFPYPKRLNAILEVNQGAALLVASEEAARRLGVARSGMVYPRAGVDVAEHWFLTERENYHTLPGLRRAGAALLAAADTSLDAIAHLDLYSCFPIAARLTADMLGLAPDADRPLTVTGGLPWFGGAGNDYATHALAAMRARLLADGGGLGLVHALGWNLTKHALVVLGTTPAPYGWTRVASAPLQARIDARPRPALAPEADGRATVEAYTVVHGRDGGPERGVVIGRLHDQRRFIAELPCDTGLLADLERAEGVGVAGTVRCDRGHNVFAPA